MAGDVAEETPDPIAIAQQRVVKLYGSKIANEKGYGSGIVVSPDGQILTVSSLMLEGTALRAVMPDGTSYPAKVIRRDPRRQLALLKIEAVDLPHFTLGSSADLHEGDWVFAAANPFKVADGPEPVSISRGIVSARTNLAARRRAQDFSYEGPVLLIDALVANPGAAGGALFDVEGHLVGLIGKPVTARRTNTWLNYALPVEELAAFVHGPAESPPASPEANIANSKNGEVVAPRLDLGIRMFDVGGRLRPAFVERVRPDSRARRAGLRPNDLIVSLNDQTIATCENYNKVLATIAPDAAIRLIVKRGDAIETITIPADKP